MKASFHAKSITNLDKSNKTIENSPNIVSASSQDLFKANISNKMGQSYYFPNRLKGISPINQSLSFSKPNCSSIQSQNFEYSILKQANFEKQTKMNKKAQLYISKTSRNDIPVPIIPFSQKILRKSPSQLFDPWSENSPKKIARFK